MYVVAIHDIAAPDTFWAKVQATPIPEGIKLHQVFPSADGTKAACLWEADSQDAVRNLVEDTVGQYSRNEFFEVERGNAVGLPG